jgi:hypothetical protein
MRVKLFLVPAHGGEAEAELNQFLGGHRVVSMERNFVAPAARFFAEQP